jgi:hypothetical protein
MPFSTIPIFKLLLCAIALIAASLFSAPAYPQGAHGDGHDKLHHWYQSLRDQHGVSCCSGVDCRPTQSRAAAGRTEVMVDGAWTPVPPEKILDKASPDLGSHVCSPLQPSAYPKGHIFCVVLGSGV